MTDAGSTAGLTIVHDAAELVVGPDEGTDVAVLGDAVSAALDNEVVAIGPTAKVSADYPVEDTKTAIDATSKTVLPGFVGPYIHALLAGDCPDEFVVKLQGTAYEGILADGGGILRTVDAVRGVSDDELAVTLADHLDAMLTHGMTTVEVKTGYGLDTETELRILSVIDAVSSDYPVDVIPMFMGAHVAPRGADAEEYTESVISDQLPVVAAQGIAEFYDVFCEHGVFTAEQSRRILDTGHDHSLTPKIHADEFAAIGGTDVTASTGVASADHLLHIDGEGRDTLVDAGITPVLPPDTASSPGTDYAGARAFLDVGHKVALATDFNPNCFAQSMGPVATPASIGMRMTPYEAIRGVTSAAAGALDRDDGTGTLCTGASADAVVLDVLTASHLPCWFDTSPVSTVLKSGVVTRE